MGHSETLGASNAGFRHRERTPETPPVGASAGFGTRLQAFLLTIGLVVVTLVVGWMVWSVLEWRHGRTASYRITGLRVVRRSDGHPIGIGRSILRNAICCTLLIVPTMVVCAVLGLVFVMGASPPTDLLRRPRLAPWDLLAGTKVLNERTRLGSHGEFHVGSWPRQPVSMN
jgi:uncharacterized RDD family membrane protein YckC